VANLIMKSPDFFREVERGKILPLYYFYGPESWLVEEALNKIRKKALNPATQEFNREVFDAQESSLNAILQSLQVFPAHSPRRLVVIRQADVLWKKSPAPFIEYFLTPNSSTCAVFIGEKADLRTKFFQALEKNGAVIPFYHPYETELIRFVRSQAEQLDCSISEEALSMLLERVGPNLRDLQLELQKLSLKPGTKKNIKEEDVLALTDDIREEGPFELPRAVGHLDWKKAFRLVQKNLQQGDSPLLLLSLIIRQFRLLRRARELREEGCSRKEVEAKLRIMPQRADDFWKQADNFSPSTLKKIWPLTREADQELKSSPADKGVILEKYLWNLHFLGRSEVRKSPRR